MLAKSFLVVAAVYGIAIGAPVPGEETHNIAERAAIASTHYTLDIANYAKRDSIVCEKDTDANIDEKDVEKREPYTRKKDVEKRKPETFT